MEGNFQKKKTSKTQSRKSEVKVVYISTPMKVKTSASRFREIVQELTGRESDVVRIMEKSGGQETWNYVVDEYDHYGQKKSTAQIEDESESPTSSDSQQIVSEPLDLDHQGLMGEGFDWNELLCEQYYYYGALL